MNKKMKELLSIGVITIFLTTTANATLEFRLGGKAVYDSNQNITWLADPSVASPNVFDNGKSNNDGFVTHSNAFGWLANLNVAGVTGWRATEESNRYYNPGFVATEVDYLIDELLQAPSAFSDAFGLKSYWAVGALLVCGGQPCSDPGADQSAGPIAIGFYLDASALRPYQSIAYDNGFLRTPDGQYPILAMHGGDVFAQISEPTIVALLGIGLFGLLGFSRLRQHKC